MDGERLGVGEGLNGDIQLRVGTEVAASVAEIWAFEKGRVGKGLFVTFKAVTTSSLALLLQHLIFN